MSGPLDIVFLSHTHRGSVYTVGSHHLSREAARRGHRVVHVATPLSLAHTVLRRGDERRHALARLGPHEMVDGVVDVIPRPLLPANVRWKQGQMAQVLAECGLDGVDVFIVDQPLLAFPEMIEATVVLRPTDHFPPGVLQARAVRLAAHCHGVVATSDVVLRSLPVPEGTPTMVLPNGVELERFEGVTASQRRGVVYVGALDERFDLVALRQIAEAVAPDRVDVYGPCEHLDRSGWPANLTFHGPVDYDDLPSVLSGYAVGIMPFSDAPAQLGRSPMKLFEYLSAGLYVVASSPQVVGAEAGVSVYTRGLSGQEGAGGTVRAALTLPTPNADGVSAARRHSWSVKAGQLLEFVERVRVDEGRRRWAL